MTNKIIKRLILFLIFCPPINLEITNYRIKFSIPQKALRHRCFFGKVLLRFIKSGSVLILPEGTELTGVFVGLSVGALTVPSEKFLLAKTMALGKHAFQKSQVWAPLLVIYSWVIPNCCNLL
jgi:hypothetical protein